MKNPLSFFGREVVDDRGERFGWELGGGEETVSEALPWISRSEDEGTGPMTLGAREVDGGFGAPENE
jgi:hypothetical protein